jgi:hypothetical protein
MVLRGIVALLVSVGLEKQLTAQEEGLRGPVPMSKYEFPKNARV